MGQQGTRTAFNIWPAYEHLSKTSLISTVAVDDAGEHMYLGLTDGQLEEHRVSTAEQDVRVSLGARKHVGKKVQPSSIGCSELCLYFCVCPSAVLQRHYYV